MKTDFTASSSTRQKYPVIDPEPDSSKIGDDIKIADILTFVPGYVAMAYCLRPTWRGLMVGGLVGVFTGYHYAYVASHSRLTGLMEKMNTDFTASSCTKQKYPVIDRDPDISKIFHNMKRADIAHMATFLPSFVTMGYLMAPKPAMRVEGMVFGCLSGVFCGCDQAYRASYSRLTGLSKNDDEVAKYNKK